MTAAHLLGALLVPALALVAGGLALRAWRDGRRADPRGRDTIGLHGDLDDVELLEAVETAFALRITDAEAAALRDVGGLEDLIAARTGTAAEALRPRLHAILHDFMAHPGPITRRTSFFAEDAPRG